VSNSKRLVPLPRLGAMLAGVLVIVSIQCF
jgi:hypothetical protein